MDSDSLEKLSVELSQAALHNEKDSENGLIEDDRFVGLQAGVEVTSPHQRLLMVLSNCGFCKAYLVPELSKRYKPVWMHPGYDSLSLFVPSATCKLCLQYPTNIRGGLSLSWLFSYLKFCENYVKLLALLILLL